MKLKEQVISPIHLRKLNMLRKDFYGIYGGINAEWSLDDLNEMTKIGQEFMEVFYSKDKTAKTIFDKYIF